MPQTVDGRGAALIAPPVDYIIRLETKSSRISRRNLTVKYDRT